MAKGNGPGKKRKPPVDLSKLDKKRPPKPVPQVEPTPVARTQELPLRLPEDIHWKQLGIFACIAATLAIFAYVNSIGGSIVFQDRNLLVSYATTPDWQQFFNDLGSDAVRKPLTQPWVRLSYALDWLNNRSNFSWYHSANIAIHTFTTFYVFLLSWRLSHIWKLKDRFRINEEFVGLATAAIFACHPLASETVAYLSSRSPLIATNNFMLALNMFLMAVLAKHWRTKTIGWLLTAGAAIMCLLSGTEVLALPAVMLLTLWSVKPSEQAYGDWLMARVAIIAPCLLLTVALPILLVLGVTHPGGTSYALDILKPQDYALAQLNGLIVYYFPKFVLPFGLSIDPQYAWRNLGDLFTLAGLIGFVALAAAALKFRKFPFVPYAAAFTLISFLPHIIILQTQVVADSAFYLPLVGLCLLVGGLLSILYRRDFRVAAGALAMIVVALMSLTIWRNTEWSSDVALWESTVRAAPKSPRANAMLSLEYAKLAQKDKAIAAADRATANGDNVALAWVSKGNASLLAKDYPRAEEAFNKAIGITQQKPAPVEVTTASGLGLAEAFVRQHKADKALTILYQVAGNAKGDRRAAAIAGLAQYDLKDWNKAHTFLTQAVKMNNQDMELRARLAEVGLETNRYDEALQGASVLAQYAPSAENQILLARALYATNHAAEATKLLEELVKTEPKNAEALAMLSKAASNSGDNVQAEKYKAQAIALDPAVFSKHKFKEVVPQVKPSVQSQAPTTPPAIQPETPRPAAPAPPSPVKPAP